MCGFPNVDSALIIRWSTKKYKDGASLQLKKALWCNLMNDAVRDELSRPILKTSQIV